MSALSIAVREDIQAALAGGRPVVALESTVISHGLPWPENARVALAMEAAVRDSGALPATIAVLEGVVTVGLTAGQIEALARLPRDGVRKCSRRDLAIAVARGETAATTVAGTMLVAHAAGIRIFATGGIGGVHRGNPHDVSADLAELGRTPVAVVCSGAKAILDLPLTLEVLETQGVPVIGLGTAGFPAFYCRDSGLPVDVAARDTAEAARIVRCALESGLGGGVLVAVPVPEEAAMGVDECERAVGAAVAEAEQQGVRGKALTPFLLARVAELTGGRSKAANLALLVNNARVAGELSCLLSRLSG